MFLLTQVPNMLGAGIDGYVVDLRNPPAWLDSSDESSGISDDAFDEVKDNAFDKVEHRAAFEPRPQEPQPQEAEPQPQDADAQDDGWGHYRPPIGDIPLPSGPPRAAADGNADEVEDPEAVVATFCSDQSTTNSTSLPTYKELYQTLQRN